MGNLNRRNGFRVPLQMFLNEYVADKPYRCMSVNIGTDGLLVNRLNQPVTREKPVVGLEFELPGTSETIWARGEVRFDKFDPYFHSTGIELTGITRIHQRLLRDYVTEHRVRQLKKLLAQIRRNRMH